MKKWKATHGIALSWCGAVMIVMGSMLPPMIEAPEPPRISLAESNHGGN
jgi:hypothetical protein